MRDSGNDIWSEIVSIIVEIAIGALVIGGACWAVKFAIDMVRALAGAF